MTTCPTCGGRIAVPPRTTLDAVLAVHAETCPRPPKGGRK